MSEGVGRPHWYAIGISSNGIAMMSEYPDEAAAEGDAAAPRKCVPGVLFYVVSRIKEAPFRPGMLFADDRCSWGTEDA